MKTFIDIALSRYTFIVSYLHRKRRDACCEVKEKVAGDTEEKSKEETYEKKRLKEKEKQTEESLTQEAKAFN